MSDSVKSDKDSKYRSIYQMGKKLKESHGESVFAHSKWSLFFTHEFRKASIFLSSKYKRKINLFKTYFFDELILTQSSTDFVTKIERFIDAPLFQSIMAQDELDPDELSQDEVMKIVADSSDSLDEELTKMFPDETNTEDNSNKKVATES